MTETIADEGPRSEEQPPALEDEGLRPTLRQARKSEAEGEEVSTTTAKRPTNKWSEADRQAFADGHRNRATRFTNRKREAARKACRGKVSA